MKTSFHLKNNEIISVFTDLYLVLFCSVLTFLGQFIKLFTESGTNSKFCLYEFSRIFLTDHMFWQKPEISA